MAAADTAKLVAQLSLDNSAFNRGLASANKGIGGLEKTLNNVGKRAGQGLSSVASNLTKIGTIGAIGAVGLLAKSVEQASSLNEAINKTSVVFGDASASVLEFGKTTADSIGISNAEALIAAGNFGNMFNTVGLAEDQSAEFSKTLVTLAADMASFNDEDPSEMLDRLRSGLSGEAEPLRRFGVLLSEAEVKEEAYREGIAKRGDALTEAQKVQARYSLILKQTTKQQGDFQRTNESFANVMRRIKGNLADAGAVIGTALLPKVSELALKFNKLVVDNAPAIQEFANKLPGAFDKVASFAARIPWEAIGSGLEKAAFFADKLFDTFLSLPPEVQGTLIALAGLNKLSGGAITGIVAELGKGLIKGVLGIQAAQVNITAANVSGIGTGAAGAAGAAGGASKVLGAVQKVFMVGIAGVVGFEIASELAKRLGASVSDDPVDNFFRVVDGFKAALNQGGLFDAFSPGDGNKINQHLSESIATSKAEGAKNQQAAFAVKDAVNQGATITQQAAFAVRDAEVASKYANQQAAAQVRDAVRTSGSTLAARSESLRAATAAGLERTRAAAQAAAFAIRDKDLSVSVATTNIVNNTISVRETIRTQTTHKQYQRFVS